MRGRSVVMLCWLLALAGELFALRFYGGIFVERLKHPYFVMPADLGCFRMNAALAQGYHLTSAAIRTASCAFMYPPPFLLLASPLSWVSPPWAYVLWGGVSVAVLTLGARAAKFSWRAIALGLVSPPSLYCVMTGQSGEIISGLLLLGLALAETNPILAGVATGCLIIKPQFALLLPICFLASRRWRLMFTAALTVMVICLLSLWAFGLSAWRLFETSGIPTARAVLDAPWPQAYAGIMVSIFMMLRSLGGGVGLASGLQLLATLGALVFAWYLWRPRTQIELDLRLLVTLCLVPLATPYAYIYDISAIAVALAAAMLSGKRQFLLPFALFWLVSGTYILISMVSYVVGGILLLLLAASLWSMRGEGAGGQKTHAARTAIAQ